MELELPRRKVSKSWRAAASYTNWHTRSTQLLALLGKVFSGGGKSISAVPVRC